MTDKIYPYDKNLPYVVPFQGAVMGRFPSASLAGSFAAREGFEPFIDTTPAPPMPTVPGIYVPRNNVKRLGQTNSYRLDEDGRWHESFNGDSEGEDRAKYAHENLGGLVRLEPALEETEKNND